MFELPIDELQSLHDERRSVLQLYENGQLDEDQATLRLLRVSAALRYARAKMFSEPAPPPGPGAAYL